MTRDPGQMTAVGPAGGEGDRPGWVLGATLRRAQGVLGGAAARQVVDEAGRRLRCRGLVRVERRHPSGRVRLGERVQLEGGVRLIVHEGARIALGDRVYVNRGVRIEAASSVTIGDGCLLGHDVVIVDSDLHALDGAVDTRPVVVEDHVWIGMRALVLPGVRIGRGAVVGAGAVVTADVAPATLVAGVPARVLRSDVRWDPRRRTEA